MPILFTLQSPFTAVVAAALFASLWQGTLLVLLVALGMRLLPGLTSAARAAIWAAVLVLVALHPVLAFAGRSAAPTNAGPVHVAFGFSVFLVAAWALASLVRLGQLAIGAVQLWSTLRAAQPLASTPAITALLRQSPRRPRLCVSDRVHRPSVAGFFRPTLLLPADLIANLHEGELIQIVLHELEHLRRGDDWINLLQQFALVLLPLHPALFWLNRRLALERELACDDAVLATTHAGKAYAACLAHLAERSLLRRGLSLALGALGRRGSELTARVERILRRPERTLTGTPLRLATGLVLAGTAATAGLLAHSPRFVSFGPAASPTSMASMETQPGSRLLPVLAPMPNALVGSTGRAMLVKANLPAVNRVAGARISRRAATLHMSLRRRIHQPASPRVLLTEWQGPASRTRTASGTRLVPVLFTGQLRPVLVETNQVWYTAVPFRGGWLVVQL